MLTSPLARVIAPQTTPAATVTLANPNGYAVPKPGEPKPEPRPNFGAFIEKYMTNNKLAFTSYIDTEAKVRATAGQITAAISVEFPEWEVIENIEAATYKPPFAVSWDFKKKGGK